MLPAPNLVTSTIPDCSSPKTPLFVICQIQKQDGLFRRDSNCHHLCLHSLWPSSYTKGHVPTCPFTFNSHLTAWHPGTAPFKLLDSSSAVLILVLLGKNLCSFPYLCSRQLVLCFTFLRLMADLAACRLRFQSPTLSTRWSAWAPDGLSECSCICCQQTMPPDAGRSPVNILWN